MKLTKKVVEGSQKAAIAEREKAQQNSERQQGVPAVSRKRRRRYLKPCGGRRGSTGNGAGRQHEAQGASLEPRGSSHPSRRRMSHQGRPGRFWARL